jgi:hypothetical protein
MRTNWKDIRTYYIHHDITLEECAKKFNVNLRTMQNYSSKEKWVDLREKKREEISLKSEEKITEQAVNRKIAANEIHNELYQKGLEVAKLILEGYLRDLKEGKKRTNANAYNMDFIMKAIANAQKGQRLCLNIGAEDNADSQPEVYIIKGLDEDKI